MGTRTDPSTGRRLYAIDALTDRIGDLRREADRLEKLLVLLQDNKLCEHEGPDEALWWLITKNRW
jgi:hypothetical protein